MKLLRLCTLGWLRLSAISFCVALLASCQVAPESTGDKEGATGASPTTEQVARGTTRLFFATANVGESVTEEKLLGHLFAILRYTQDTSGREYLDAYRADARGPVSIVFSGAVNQRSLDTYGVLADAKSGLAARFDGEASFSSIITQLGVVLSQSSGTPVLAVIDIDGTISEADLQSIDWQTIVEHGENLGAVCIITPESNHQTIVGTFPEDARQVMVKIQLTSWVTREDTCLKDRL